MSIQLYPSVQALYQELYRQCTLYSNFKYRSTAADRKLVCKFIKWLRGKYTSGQITESLLIQFFEFQFSRYSGVITPKGKNNIMLNWIIGPKAIKEWEGRNVKKRWLVRWRIGKDFKLKLSTTFKSSVTVKVVNNKIYKHEEFAKERFFATPEGYKYCALMTTLWNPVSDYCIGCPFKAECKERLKLTYQELYGRRTHTLGISSGFIQTGTSQSPHT